MKCHNSQILGSIENNIGGLFVMTLLFAIRTVDDLVTWIYISGLLPKYYSKRETAHFCNKPFLFLEFGHAELKYVMVFCCKSGRRNMRVSCTQLPWLPHYAVSLLITVSPLHPRNPWQYSTFVKVALHPAWLVLPPHTNLNLSAFQE